MHLIIYGPEGSGKGTQAELLSKKFHLPIYTSGNLVREAAQKDKTKIGEICLKALQTGQYVPDDIMFALWSKKLSSKEAQKGFILDGFPRNMNQAKFLVQTVSQYGYHIDKFIYLQISDTQAFQRLGTRMRALYKGSQISHDTPDRIKKRLATYRQKEKDTLNFFRQKNLLVDINGEQPIEKVATQIRKKL